MKYNYLIVKKNELIDLCIEHAIEINSIRNTVVRNPYKEEVEHCEVCNNTKTIEKILDVE